MNQDNKKKILILGGTFFQIPAIEYAKKQGYYVITCDYLPDNPGHKISDEYHNVSTTDKEAILELSQRLNIDGILCFASDPAAPTAAFVSEKLQLPGNPYDKVCVLGEKHLWRNFLSENGFNTPKAKSYTSIRDVDLSIFTFPIMVKPIDSSGSKGVTKITTAKELEDAFEYALSFSRAKIVILEEFIDRVGAQIGGDGFFGTDKLDFVCFGEQVVDASVNPYVPCGMKFPAILSEDLSNRIKNEIERAIQLVGLENLSFNLEVMIDKEEKIFLMEIGPRNGGNYIPEVIYNYTNINMVALAVEAAMGNSLPIHPKMNVGYHAYYALHSDKEMIFNGYALNENFPGEIEKKYIFLEKGEKIKAFNGSNQTIGVLLLSFSNKENMNLFFNNAVDFIHFLD